MRIAILIQVHKNENQIIRLINHLKRDFDLYVHIDKKSKLELDSEENVFVYKKYMVVHGGFSQITNTLFMLREAFKNNYDRYLFISGQDMPLKSNEYIINFFKKNKDKEFLLCHEVKKTDGIYDSLLKRMNNYNFGFWYRKILHVSLRTFISNIGPWKRLFPTNLYFGSTWFNITHDALEYMFKYIDKNPRYIERFKYTWGADEVVFNTILMNSNFKDKTINDDVLRYMVWNGGVPNLLLMKDYDYLKNSNALFARKFDENIDNDIIERLYNDLG